jgi:hypothetical protein
LGWNGAAFGPAMSIESIWQEHKDLPRHKNAGRSIGLPAKKD